MASVLVVDDDTQTCKALDILLRREEHTVLTATSGQKALTLLQQEPIDLLLSDVKMPRMDGLTLLREVKTQKTGTVVVMMSGHDDVAAAVAAMKEGAFDYLIKPFGKDELVRTVQKAMMLRAILVENLTLKRQAQDAFSRAQVIGSSPAWRRVCDMVEQVAPARATVLITGQSGTGKEVIASLIHRLSPRAERPFVTLNAAALPTSLLEAELFGYEKGAFTGALQRKPGRFEQADGGTLLLDEIGEMPSEVQVKLLRVLQEGTFERLGGTRTLHVDVRMVAATNKNLVQEVEAQRFREDLYYRLNVISLHLPPLCERQDDIPLLAAHFLRQYARQNNKAITGIQQQALQHLQRHPWPGNVRELENVIERAVVMAQDSTITAADLGLETQQIRRASILPDQFVLPPRATLAEIERAAIVQALEESNGNRRAAARLLDIGAATLYRKVKQYQLD